MAAKEGSVNMMSVNKVQNIVNRANRSVDLHSRGYRIRECRILDDHSKPTNFIKYGEDFLEFSKILADVQVDYVAEFHTMNLTTCKYENAYSHSIEGKLGSEECSVEIKYKFTCTKKGIFTYAAILYVPGSENFDFRCYEECFACQPETC